MWPSALFLIGLAIQDTGSTRRADTLETLVVRATRGGATAPTSQTTLERDQIRRHHAGQDVPLALNRLSSVTTTSDAGGFSGYSYLRLRGIDQTRLTISLDGVPLNDPEDQVLFFSNIPDFLNSIQSVRLQRGVASSAFGTASFAGSLNFESIPIGATEPFVQAEATAGSFGTARGSVGGATGLRGPWAGYGRVSAQTTNGYREHSGNDAWSGFTSLGWFGAKDAVKLTALAGRSKTQLAYFAAAEGDVRLDPRINPMSPLERDNFHQEMINLRYSRSLAPRTLLTATAYRNSAGGYYDLVLGQDIGTFTLDHAWYGMFATTSYTGDRWSLTAGAHASRYHRDHGFALGPSPVYGNTGFKQEQSGFLKVSLLGGRVDLHGDLEIRRAAFQYRPTAGSTLGRPSVDWTFLNPKVGLSWRTSPSWTAHLSLGRTSREPARSDLFAGADDLSDDLALVVLPLDRVKPETVTDLEAGAAYRRSTLSLTGNLFSMWFHNEIAPVGAITFIGTPIRRNVARSQRRGLEVEGIWQPRRAVTVTGNATLMRARIAEYTDEARGRTYRDVTPLLTPSVTANLAGRWALSDRLTVEAAARHVSKSQLANDDDPRLVLPAATTADLLVTAELGRVSLKAQVLNLFDALAYASGYTDGAIRFLFPIAGRSLLLTTAVRLLPR